MNNAQLRINNYQLPKGYKQTEVGVIPEDWDYDLLQDKVDLISGRHILAQKYNSVGIGTPYLTGPADFKDGTSIVSKWTQEKGVEAEYGNVLITVKGSGAGSAFNLDLPKAVISRQLMALKGKKVIQNYLFYIIKNRQSELSAKAVENLIPGLSRTDIFTLKVLLPNAEEQRSIAQALSDVDALITSMDKLIAKKRNLKTATMQQLLTGKKRLPGFGEGQGYKESAIGLIPKDWSVIKLGDVLKIRHGKSQHKVVYPNGIYPILATGGEIGRTNTPLYSQPSVLIGRKETIDIPRYMDTPFWTVDTLFYSEIFKNTNAKFIFYKFKLIDWYSYNEASGVPSLNAATIENIE